MSHKKEHPDWSTRARHQKALLGGRPSLTLEELAAAARCPLEVAIQFWRAMGFPDLDPDEPAFTKMDVKALVRMNARVEKGLVDRVTADSLLRAESHLTERLASWQIEALVDDVARRYEYDGTTSRLLVLDQIGQFLEVAAEQLQYAWRRQMLAALARIDTEVSQRYIDDGDETRYPLTRAVGFVDMQAYTSRSAQLGANELAELVSKFDMVARDVINAAGASVVKTIGDAVFYIADDLETGCEVAVSLIEELGKVRGILPVRGAMVVGDVLALAGDIYGPPVNLASRLSHVAPIGCTLTDEFTANAVLSAGLNEKYLLSLHRQEDLHGIGALSSYRMERTAS